MGPTKITQEDQQFNISFLGEVKKHPCLFDSNSTEYKQAAVQDKSWQAVSAAMEESVDTCKKRWRNLRCCMTRYLKSIRDNNDLTPNVRRKPYYLYSHMQFVLPYLKVREEGTSYEQDESSWIKQNSSAGEGLIKQDDEEGEDDVPEIETADVHEDDHHQQLKQSIIQSIKILPLNQETQAHEHQQQQELMSSAEATATTTTTYEIITATPSKQARLSNPQQSVESTSPTGTSPMQTSSDGKKGILGQRQYYTITGTPTHSANVAMPCYSANSMAQHQQTSNFNHQTSHPQPQMQTQTAQHFALIPSASTMVNDADHNFFQSLIPDIQTMTMEQKRKLKIGILQLIDGILNT